MFSSKRFQVALPNDWSSAKGTLIKSISDFFNLLNQPGALDLDSCNIRAATGIAFPVSWGAKSANVNTLDDYQEGSYTPVVTAGAGALNSYTATGAYVKVGSLVLATVDITFSDNGTGSSYILASLPFEPTGFFCGAGMNAGTSIQLTAVTSHVLHGLYIVKYDGTYPAANGVELRATVSYTTS